MDPSCSRRGTQDGPEVNGERRRSVTSSPLGGKKHRRDGQLCRRRNPRRSGRRPAGRPGRCAINRHRVAGSDGPPAAKMSRRLISSCRLVPRAATTALDARSAASRIDISLLRARLFLAASTRHRPTDRLQSSTDRSDLSFCEHNVRPVGPCAIRIDRRVCRATSTNCRRKSSKSTKFFVVLRRLHFSTLSQSYSSKVREKRERNRVLTKFRTAYRYSSLQFSSVAYTVYGP